MFVLKLPHSRLTNRKKHDSCRNNSFSFPFFFFLNYIFVLAGLNIHLFYSRRIVLERDGGTINAESHCSSRVSRYLCMALENERTNGCIRLKRETR